LAARAAVDMVVAAASAARPAQADRTTRWMDITNLPDVSPANEPYAYPARLTGMVVWLWEIARRPGELLREKRSRSVGRHRPADLSPAQAGDRDARVSAGPASVGAGDWRPLRRQ